MGADGPIGLAGGDIHHGSIVHRCRLVARFSDVIISGKMPEIIAWWIWRVLA